MARSEARIYTELWEDDDFLALAPGPQRMFLFLLSQHDLSHDGVLALRERRWSKGARGLTAGEVSADLEALEEARFIVVDEDTEELLIRSFIRRDKVYRQPNVLRSARDHLRLVAGVRVLSTLWVELQRVLSAEDISDVAAGIVTDMVTQIEKRLPQRSPNPSGGGSVIPIRDASRNPPENPSTDPSANPSDHKDAGDEGSGNPSAKGSQLRPGVRGVVTALSKGFPSPLSSDAPDPKTLSAEAGEKPPRRGKQGTRLPNDFKVTSAMVTWVAQRAPDIDGRLETEKFENYWRAKTGKDATKLDWPATWRNWMLNAQGRARPLAKASGYNGPHRVYTNPTDASAYDGDL
jgi:hypothetical protein